MKRLFDSLFVAIGLLFLSPILLLVMLIVKQDGGSSFFLQKRVGHNGQRFKIIKFRTMVVGAEKLGAQITSGIDPRITKTGALLRKLKLDELPQLINVILGQMSLVGPRPEVPKYVEKWPSDDRLKILSVRPGITDYASLIFSDEQKILAESFDPEKSYVEEIMPRKLELYKKYISEQSLWLDFRIIFATLLKIVGGNPDALLPEIKSADYADFRRLKST